MTYLSNYSPHMTPDQANYYSLLCRNERESGEADARATTGAHGGDDRGDDHVGLENAGLLEPGERKNIVSRWCYLRGLLVPDAERGAATRSRRR